MVDLGEEYECRFCGDTHIVQEDTGGFSAAMGFDQLYVECPEYGYVPISVSRKQSMRNNRPRSEQSANETRVQAY